MKPKKAKPKVCHRKLPPHSWEAHPSANQGEANKQLIIAVITISAIIVLGVLLLFSEQIVGKAFFVPGKAFTAGIVEPTAPIIENTPFSLKVKANIDQKETVAVEFKLNLPQGTTCDEVQVGVPDLLDWDEQYLVEDTSDCIDSQIVFSFATLNTDEAKSGEFEVAQLNFKDGAPAGKYKLKFESFNIYDIDDKDSADLIANGETAEILVEEAAPEEECGNGKPDIGENCLTCPADIKCPAGQTCSDAGACVPDKLVCTPNEYSCLDEKTVVRCNPDGKAYTKIADCADTELCENGKCVEIAEPVCTANEYFCFNLTQVARCDSDGMDSSLQAVCKDDETCSAGACVKKAPSAVCTDSDLLDYQKKGTTTDNTITLTDECSSPEILKEGKCLDGGAVYVDVDCPENFGDDFACNEGTCIFKGKIKPMKIELLGSTGLAVAATDTLSVGENYQIKVTVTPLEEDLGKHLLIAQVAYNNQSNTYIYESKGNLSVDEEETIEFVHKVAALGEIKVEAFVWGNWPSVGPGNALMESVEVKYEIK